MVRGHVQEPSAEGQEAAAMGGLRFRHIVKK